MENYNSYKIYEKFISLITIIGKSNITEKPIHEVNFITFCYVLIPKEIIENIGLLDESYFMYVEDLDYSYRVWKSGYKLYHVSSSKIYHKVGASSGEEVSEFSAYWMMRNRVRFIKEKFLFPYNLSSFTFLFLTRVIRYFAWINKIKIIKAQLNGIIDGFKK